MVRIDPYARLVDQLQCEYRCRDVGALADRILAAEAADFHWEARVRERYLGQWIGIGTAPDDGEDDLARMAVLSLLGGRWHAGICVVDGEGEAVQLLWLQSFAGLEEAESAFARTR